MVKVIVFSLNGCKPCEKLKEKLEQEGIPFEEKQIKTFDELREIDYREFPTVEIENNGEKIVRSGCSDEVIEEIKRLATD
ncbi:MAG: hypothetical protein DRN95_02695 [Candidatus Hydrothermarchaeota archaeon]|nr:MAG: hypothetical protein DRN95_02695 [Candidatus Hydrothermarchaeota archaeon]